MKLKEKILVLVGIIASSIPVLTGWWKCPWKNTLNIDCVGCGTTRMLFALLKLDFYQAFRYNPFVFSLLVISLIYGLYAFISIKLKKNYYKPSYKLLYVLAILAITFMIIRNIDGFEYLKPTEV